VFRLSATDTIWLKQNGVSDPVVQEMLATANRVPRRVYTAAPVYEPVYVVEPPPPVSVGVGFGYARRSFARTVISHVERGGRSLLTIGPANGRFSRMLSRRSWQVRLLGIPRPHIVSVDGRALRSGQWSYDAPSGTAIVNTGSAATDRAVRIVAR